MGKKTDNPESIAGAIKALDIGQTFSRTVRVAVGDKRANVNEALAALRNSTNQAVSKIRKATERAFRVESAPALTDDRAAVLCTVAVTRMESEDEDVDI